MSQASLGDQLLFTGQTRWSGQLYKNIIAPSGEVLDVQTLHQQLFGMVVKEEDTFSYDLTTKTLQRHPNVRPSELVTRDLDFAHYLHEIRYYDTNTSFFRHLYAGVNFGVLDGSGVVVYLRRFNQNGNGSSSDADKDGKPDTSDNCPDTANPDQLDSDSDGIGNACDQDDDNDGLTDIEEQNLGTNPLLADSDGDGLEDGSEVTAGTNPLNADSDGDGISDGVEVGLGRNPLINEMMGVIPAIINLLKD